MRPLGWSPHSTLIPAHGVRDALSGPYPMPPLLPRPDPPSFVWGDR